MTVDLHGAYSATVSNWLVLHEEILMWLIPKRSNNCVVPRLRADQNTIAKSFDRGTNVSFSNAEECCILIVITLLKQKYLL